MSIAIWFDGDDILWDRQGFMLSTLEAELNAPGDESTREPQLYGDVLPTCMALMELGTINLIQYSAMPSTAAGLLPPFSAYAAGPTAPSNALPELHATESRLNWLETLEAIDAASKGADDVIIVSNSLAVAPLAAERGWLTVWLNRDRVANLAEALPDAEIHSLLDLPEALEARDEARAAVQS